MSYLRLYNAAEPFLSHTQENVRLAGCPASVNSNSNAAIGGVFEPCRHRQNRGEFSVYLRFGRSRPNSAPRHEVGRVLRADGIQKFATCGKTKLRKIKKQSPSDAQSPVYLESPVHVRVVDETLPSNGSTGLLEVDPHDDVEIIFGLLSVCAEQPRIFHR